METPKKPIPETFSVEQAFVINVLFFIYLWPLVEPRITEEERLARTYSLFFVTVCAGDECYAEWNEAIRRALCIPKEEQKTLRLSLPEIFSCALEFCKLHNECYGSEIAYAVFLLESMKKDPEKYKQEWAVWQDAIEQTVNKYMDSEGFDWSDKLATWPKQNIDPLKGDQI